MLTAFLLANFVHILHYPVFFPQLGKNIFPVRKKIFPNWEKITPLAIIVPHLYL